jgi:hypothetical protein
LTDDELYCTVDRCRPGPEADATGCVVEAGPCAAGERCDEATDRCDTVDCTVPDGDGDGAAALLCGGGDCDDDDGDRFPGNPEVCDAEGHDEDCRDDTFARVDSGDADGDGFVSDACCNGDRCGGDCDDSVASVHPSASETCNGIDDDCSGVVDDGTGPVPLCPGGVCLSGRCAFTSWDRVLGNGGNDRAKALATDTAGNVYVSGGFLDGSDFGSGDTDNALVVSYSAGGILRWVFTYGAPLSFNSAEGTDLAYDPADDALYLLGNFDSSVTFGTSTLGSGTGGGFLVRLDSGGTVDWAVPLPFPSAGVYRGGSVAVHEGRIVVVSSFLQAFDFGDGTTHTPVGTEDAYIAEYDSGGTLTRVRTYGAAGAVTELIGVATDRAGNIYAVGTYTGRVDLGDGARTAMSRAAALVSLAADGTRRWARIFDSSAVDGAESVAVGRDMVFVAGNAGGTLDFGGGAVGPGGFLVALSLDGTYGWERVQEGYPMSTDGRATPLDVAAYDDDRVWVVGTFEDTVDFGNGALVSEGTDIFTALYGAGGLHLRDRALGEDGLQEARAVVVGPGGALTIAGVFSGSVSFDSGMRTAAVGQSGFVARVLY